MIDIGTLAGRITLKDEASAALGTFQTNLRGIGSALTGAGTALTAGITLPLVGAAAASLSFSGKFDASMTRLVAIAGVSQKELAGVKQHILELAPATGIGPQALADAMTKVSSTVSDTKTALSILDIAAQGTKAGFGETVSVAGALTTVINSYGAENITASRAADILAQAIKEGGAEASELAPTLANVVPFAKQMGVSFEEVSANIATMTKLGVPTSEAVTSLTSVFSAMSKETDQGAAALEKMELSYGELRQQIREKGLAATLTDLQSRFGGNVTAMNDVFGRLEAVKNIMGTAGSQATTYAEVLGKIKTSSDNAGGAMKNMADAMSGKQVQSWNQLTSLVQVLAIRLGDVLAPAFGKVLSIVTSMVKYIEPVIQAFTKLPGPIQTLAIGFLALLAAAGPVLLIAGSLVTAWAAVGPLLVSLGGFVGILKGAFLALTGPIGLTVLAVGALYAGLKYFGLLDNVIDFFKKLATWVGSTVVSAFNTLKGAALAVVDSGFGKLIAAIGNLIGRGLAAWVRNTWEGFQTLGGWVTKVWGWLQDLSGWLGSKFSTQISSNVTALKLFGDGFKWVIDMAEKLAGKLAGLLDLLGQSQGEMPTVTGGFSDLANRGLKPAFDATLLLDTTTQGLNNTFAPNIKLTKDVGGAHKEATDEAKKHAEAIQTLRDKFSGAALIKDLSSVNTALLGSGSQLRLTKDDAEALYTQFQELRDRAGEIPAKFNAIQQAVALVMLKNLEPEAKASAGALWEMAGKSKELGVELLLLPSTIEPAIDAFKRVGESIESAEGNMIGFGVSIKNEGESVIKPFLDGIKEKKDAAAAASKRWKDQIGALAGAFANLAQVSGGSLNKVATQIGTLVTAFDTAIKAQENFKAGQEAWGKGNRMQGISGMATGIMGIASAAIAAGQALHKLFFGAQQEHKKVNDLRDSFIAAHGGLQLLNAKAIEAGMTLTQLLNAKKIKDFESAVASLEKGIDTFAASAEADQNRLTAAMQAYGLSWENAGTKMRQAEIDKMAKELVEDFRVLTRVGGFEVSAVLDGMTGKVNEFVASALRTGTEIPAAMKPMLEEMVAMGKLTDDNGVALTDLSKLTFAETLTQGFDRVVGAIERLVGKLAIDLPAAAGTAADGVTIALAGIRAPTIHVPVVYDIPDLTADGGGAGVTVEKPSYYASGGNVIAFKARGTDTVPAMLTPGERVLTVQQAREYDRDNGEHGEGFNHTLMTLQAIERNLADQPRALRIAFEDAMALSSRRAS